MYRRIECYLNMNRNELMPPSINCYDAQPLKQDGKSNQELEYQVGKHRFFCSASFVNIFRHE